MSSSETPASESMQGRHAGLVSRFVADSIDGLLVAAEPAVAARAIPGPAADRRDPEVADFVLKQPSAKKLLDDLQRIVSDLLPHYREKGRSHLVVAFGCTGGRHRSVVLASEMARRLEHIDGIDVEFTARDI